MDEVLAKFINEGKLEYEEMEIFIREFRTGNELLMKEQNNLLSELKFKVNELSRVMNDVFPEKPQEVVMENEPPQSLRTNYSTYSGVKKTISSFPQPVEEGKGRSTVNEVFREPKATPYQYPIYRSFSANAEDSEIKKSIRRTHASNTAYPAGQEIEGAKNISNEHLYSTCTNEIDEKNPEIKDLPSHLEYSYLYNDKSFPIFISSKFSEKEKRLLLQVLEKRKGVIAWKMSNIKGISSSFFTHKIQMEDYFKLVTQP
ncbi:hypothetical protein Tco_0928184 [Tanacetum coccineum]